MQLTIWVSSFTVVFLTHVHLASVNLHTVKILYIRTPKQFAVITLKFEQDGFTKE